MPLQGSNGPEQATYINNGSDFNDYVQTALLTASFVTQQQTNALLRQAAAERKLGWWRQVVRERYPAVNGVMEVEDAALMLMAWDETETAAQDRRGRGLHLPRTIRWSEVGWGFAKHTFFGVFGVFVTIGLCLVAGVVVDLNTGMPVEDIAVWMNRGLLLYFAVWSVLALLVLTAKFRGPIPPRYDPTWDSALCQRFAPGGTISTTTGHRFVIADWPSYWSERLRFTVTVTEHIPGVSFLDVQSGKPYVPSEIIIWDTE